MGSEQESITLEELTTALTELCPQHPVELVKHLRWLYEHPQAAEYLCGQRQAAGKEQAALLGQLGESPEYLALAAFSLLRKKKNSKGENRR